jgi:hypothetical protein
MRRGKGKEKNAVFWVTIGAIVSMWFFFGYPALADWNQAPQGTPPADNLPSPIWNASAPGFGGPQNASLSISGSAGFGGYNPDPLWRISTPSAYIGTPPASGTTISSGNIVTDGTVTMTGLKLTTGAAAGSILVSDAAGNASWTPFSLDYCSSGGVYDHLTAASYNGVVSVNGKTGYAGADEACGVGYHLCTPDDILRTVACSPASLPGSGIAWIGNGAPSFTSPAANDCAGWTSAGNTTYGSFWQFNGASGGKGFSTSCNLTMKIACCI